MGPRRLDNYLRAHRKNAGLTQEEVAFLLGFDNANLVSRYEKRQRMPPLQTALAYEAIFGVPVAELFAGMRQGVIGNLKKRRSTLTARLQANDRTGSAARMRAHKLHSLGVGEPSVATGEHMALQ